MGAITRTLTIIIFLPILLLGGGDMTQISRPQPGRNTTYPDAGPYSSDQWADLLKILHVGDESDTRGVVAAYLNRLEVSENPADTVEVETGAGLVNGHLLINDATVSITPTAPGVGNTRQDRVVLVNNNTAVTYSTNLDTPAPYAAGVPAYSTRIAVLQGDPAANPTPRALVQTANYWMIELAQYSITGAAGTISAMTDYRSYMDAETKRIISPAVGGYDDTGGAAINYTEYDGIVMANNTDSKAFGHWALPVDYIANLSIKAIARPLNGASGNIYISHSAYYGTCGESFVADTFIPALAAEAVTAGQRACVGEIVESDLVNLAAGDMIALQFRRDATDPLDTQDDDIAMSGFLITYLGYRR